MRTQVFTTVAKNTVAKVVSVVDSSMQNKIVATLISCVLISAVGGFGAPLWCKTSTTQDRCGDNWRAAAAGALTAAGTLGTLLASLTGKEKS